MGFLPSPKHPFEVAKELHDMISLVQRNYFDWPMINHSDEILDEVFEPGAIVKDIEKFEFPKLKN